MIDRATPSDDVEDLVSELSSIKQELEIQNQLLGRAQAELAESEDRYGELYDQAPIGYITLDRDGIVREANFAAAELLELNRGQLLGAQFSRFVSHSCEASWHRHLKTTLEAGCKESCGLQLRSGQGHVLSVRLESAAIPRKDSDRGQSVTEMRIAIVDQTECRRSPSDAWRTGRAIRFIHEQ